MGIDTRSRVVGQAFDQELQATTALGLVLVLVVQGFGFYCLRFLGIRASDFGVAGFSDV